MASLRKFTGSKYWYACFTMPDGRRVQRSTREIDRKKAQRLAETFEEATRAKLTARAAQRIISEIYTKATGERLPSSTVRAYFESWLVRKKPETAAATFAFYQGKAKSFLTFLGERAEVDIGRIDAREILAFRKAESERVSPSTVNHALKLLRMIFEQARRDGLLVDSPTADISILKRGNQTGRRPFTLPEMNRLLGVADPEWRGLLLFGFYTGQRLGDLCRLTWANVDLERAELRFTAGKTGRRQILPLAAPLLRHLERMPAGDALTAPLHPRAFKSVSAQGRTSTVSRAFADLMAQAGLLPARDRGKDLQGQGKGRGEARRSSEISFHALRHTATSLMKNAGISAAIVQEFIGHESAAVNAHYTHIETESLRRAAEALPDLLIPSTTTSNNSE